MILRYTRKETQQLWSDISVKSQWLRVEAAILWAKEQLGLVPVGSAASVEEIVINQEMLAQMDEREKITDHDLIAFVLTIADKLSADVQPHFHDGVTSYDVEDTALALLMKRSIGLIRAGLHALCRALMEQANRHRLTLMVGRTHGIHAEPITFGLKLLGFLDAFEFHLRRLDEIEPEVTVGKVSGAVGTYPLQPEIERRACERLGITPAKTSTQVVGRHVHLLYLQTLVAIANSLDRLAIEIRNLARTDIGEVAEKKRPGNKGSSAMPGKSRLGNPIKPENVSGLAKVVRGMVVPALECEGLWHERTLDNSSAERITISGVTTLVDFMLSRMEKVIAELVVYPDRMQRNLDLTGGIIYAQRVMMELTKAGMPRPQAYELVEGLAMQVDPQTFVSEEGQNFQRLVYSNSTILDLVDQEALSQAFDPWSSLSHVAEAFARFGL